MLGVLTACTNSYASEVKKQTIESKETFAAVGHRPKLDIGLQINGGDNIVQQDPDTGAMSIKSPKPVITENDILKYHGIYSDVDGDAESTIFTIGSSLRLLLKCPGDQTYTSIGGEDYSRQRSTKKWQFTTDLSSVKNLLKKDIVGCELFFGKLYGESAQTQTSASNITYTPNPDKSLRTIPSAFGISLGVIAATPKPFGVKDDVVIAGPDDTHPTSIPWNKPEHLVSAYKAIGNQKPAEWQIEVEGGVPGYTFSIDNQSVATVKSTGAKATITLTGELGSFTLEMRDSAGATLRQTYEIKYSGFFTPNYNARDMINLKKLNEACSAIDNRAVANPSGAYAYDFISMWSFKAMRGLNVNKALAGRQGNNSTWIFLENPAQGETHWPEMRNQYRLKDSSDDNDQLPVMCTIK